MIANLIVGAALICIVLCSWHLAQQNVLSREPYARRIGLTYGVMSMGAVAWLLSPILPFVEAGVPIFAAGLALNLFLTSLRLQRLYDET